MYVEPGSFISHMHSQKFKPEQLQAWADMIPLDQHSCLHEPPRLKWPFF